MVVLGGGLLVVFGAGLLVVFGAGLLVVLGGWAVGSGGSSVGGSGGGSSVGGSSVGGASVGGSGGSVGGLVGFGFTVVVTGARVANFVIVLGVFEVVDVCSYKIDK